jgi:putative ABC transport system ATP-binding protein
MVTVSKSFDGAGARVDAVRSVSFEVFPGELVALMGPSGSGKSSLLAMAGGLDTPDAGEVIVHGESLGSRSASDRARLRCTDIGYVFQHSNLIAALCAEENVALPLQLAGRPRQAAHREAMAALERVGLGNRADHLPEQLSGGESQRVAIARALVGGSRLILADEPTGALDSDNALDVMNLIADICSDGGAALVVTHDPLVASFAARTIRLRDGQIVMDELAWS